MAAETDRAASIPASPEMNWHRASALMLATLPEQQGGLFDLVSIRLAFETWRQQNCVLQPQQDASASKHELHPGIEEDHQKAQPAVVTTVNHCIT